MSRFGPPAALFAALLWGPPAAGQEPDPCAGESDPARRVECHAALLGSAGEEGRKWRLGVDLDQFTDELSVILRRGAEQPVRTADGELALPSLTLTCWRGRDLLLSVETGGDIQPAGGGECAAQPAPAEVTYRIGGDPPVRSSWLTSPPCQDVWLDRHGGSLFLARALAEGDPAPLLFRWDAPGGPRIARFELDGLHDLLPHVERACGSGPGPDAREGARGGAE